MNTQGSMSMRQSDWTPSWIWNGKQRLQKKTYKAIVMNAKYIQQLIIFVLILVALNFIFGNDGLHISIIGSLALTLVIGLIMSLLSGKRNG